MPELPEVEVVLQHLNTQILGATIEALAIHRSDIVRTGHNLVLGFIRRRLAKCIEWENVWF